MSPEENAESRQHTGGGYTMPPQENKALVREAMMDLWNKGNMEVADKAFAHDYVAHDPAIAHPITGPEGVKRLVTMFRSAFPNLHVTIEDQIAAGDRVVSRWMARGTHKGELMGIPPSGIDVTMVGLTISRVTEGKISEDWTNWNSLDTIRQLGAIPPSSGVGV